jgi:hypothetical protein
MYGPTPQPGQPPYPPPQSAGYPPQPGQHVYPPQPGQAVYPPQSGARPSSYWPLSIIAFLLSCLFGGIAMFFSYQVGEKMKRGDVVGAGKASRMALIFSIVGIVIGGIALLYMLSTGGGGY